MSFIQEIVGKAKMVAITFLWEPTVIQRASDMYYLDTQENTNAK